MKSINPEYLNFIENLRSRVPSPYKVFENDLRNKYIGYYCRAFDIVNRTCNMLIEKEKKIEELEFQLTQLEEFNTNLLDRIGVEINE